MQIGGNLFIWLLQKQQIDSASKTLSSSSTTIVTSSHWEISHIASDSSQSLQISNLSKNSGTFFSDIFSNND